MCFVDIDFPDLIERKCNIISATPQLNKLLDPFETPSKPEGVHLRSAHYVALGCDLGDTEKLDKMLRSEVDVARSLILCTAEVSITYMDLQAADALISWASSFENGTWPHSKAENADSIKFAFASSNSIYLTVPNIPSPER